MSCPPPESCLLQKLQSTLALAALGDHAYPWVLFSSGLVWVKQLKIPREGSLGSLITGAPGPNAPGALPRLPAQPVRRACPAGTVLGTARAGRRRSGPRHSLGKWVRTGGHSSESACSPVGVSSWPCRHRVPVIYQASQQPPREPLLPSYRQESKAWQISVICQRKQLTSSLLRVPSGLRAAAPLLPH